MSTTERPDTAALVGRFDIYDEGHAEVLHDFMEHARGHCPVHRTEASPGYWLVTSYDCVRDALAAPQLFSSEQGTNVNGQSGVHTPPIDVDPPLHRAYRNILKPFFTPGAVQAHEDAMRAVAARLLDAVVPAGGLRVVEDFAGPYVAEVLGRTLLEIDDVGVMEEMRHQVHLLATTKAADAFRRLHDVMLDRCRVERPRPRGVLEALSTAQLNGRELSEAERSGMALLLFLGGLDTTTAAITNMMWRLATMPGLESEMRRAGWERSVFDELLRLDSPLTGQARVATSDVEIGGATIPAGERVLLHLASANRDEAVFSDAATFAPATERPVHLAFGYGVHHCIGAHFARLKVKVAFEELLARVTGVRLARDRVHFSPGVVRSPQGLAVTFDRLPTDA